MKTRLIIPALIITAVGLGAFGLTQIHAQTPTGQQTLIDMLVSRFNLNKTDVQSVFTQFRQNRQTTMMTNFDTRIDQLVKDGKLTAGQGQKIKDKEAQIKIQMSSSDWQNLTPQQRKDKLTQLKTDLQTWAKDNNIPTQYLPFLGGFGRGFKMGFNMGMHRGWNKTTITPTPTK